MGLLQNGIELENGGLYILRQNLHVINVQGKIRAFWLWKGVACDVAIWISAAERTPFKIHTGYPSNYTTFETELFVIVIAFYR